MKRSLSLLATLAVLFSGSLPDRRSVVRADDFVAASPVLQGLAFKGWESLSSFRAQIEAKHNVTLTHEGAWRTFKSIFPRTARDVEDQAVGRWGVEVIELENRLVRFNMYRKGGSAKQSGWEGLRGFVGRFAPITFVWFAIQMNMQVDNYIETRMIEDLVEQGWPIEDARIHANTMTDNLRYLVDPSSWIVCAMNDNHCTPAFLNELERIMERGADRGMERYRPDNERPVMRTPPPQGNGPGEYILGVPFQTPCGGGFSDFGTTPTVPPSVPGTNGTVPGTVFTETTNVTGRDPCKSGKR
jgi:hypothetical protein